MTTITNTETLPDGTPIANVLVEVRIFGPTPAAMATGTGSVVGSASTRSASNGTWSLSLTPNASITPAGTCYIFTRTFPPTADVQGTVIEYGIVPPNTVPVAYPTIVVSTPTAAPFTDSELSYHLSATDPHPQYLTQARADARYAPTDGGGGGSGGGSSLPTSEPHSFISDWNTATAALPLDHFATPTNDLAVGGHKVTGLAPGVASTDAATVGQLSSAPVLLGGGQHLWVQETAPTSSSTPAPQEADLWIQKSNALTHTYTSGAWVAAGTTSGRRVVQGTAAGPPTSGAYAVGEIAVAANGRIWTCITAGSPGTWYSAPLITVSSVAPSNAITGDIWVFAS